MPCALWLWLGGIPWRSARGRGVSPETHHLPPEAGSVCQRVHPLAQDDRKPLIETKRAPAQELHLFRKVCHCLVVRG